MALLITRYGLDCRPFHARTPYPVWEDSGIRKWLRSTFAPAAFTEAELEAVCLALVPDYGLSFPSGEEAQDRVFLLSSEEAAEYFPDDAARKCLPTAYALAAGAGCYTGSSSANCIDGAGCGWWWLRTSGTENNFYASYVYSEGKIYNYGKVKQDGYTVRPAIWLDIAKVMNLK